ncbi:MAG: transcriptional regulator [Polaromonas sp.]|uniref:transcriptional regulator n=1 Tax=Polaromonas sp. TaxID=1869339 RepID=UPI0024882896|nr:transcriptional regulator [Polaromonas sp.]MDI1238645.1 transcriptional regulator [Polaromonas sp.]
MPVDDKKAFAERLKTALKRLPKSIETATELAHQFNLKHQNEPITPQAAQRWLKGTAYPTADKLQTLADWLNVSAHWLKNGPPPAPRKSASGKRGQPGQPGQLNEKEARLLAKLRLLSEHQVYIVAELIDQLALEREIWADPSEK